MYDNVETIAAKLGVKQTRSPRGSQLWECWADRVLQAETHHHRRFDDQELKRRNEMIAAANAYAI